jgi:hypothetical protein
MIEPGSSPSRFLENCPIVTAWHHHEAWKFHPVGLLRTCPEVRDTRQVAEGIDGLMNALAGRRKPSPFSETPSAVQSIHQVSAADASGVLAIGSQDDDTSHRKNIFLLRVTQQQMKSLDDMSRSSIITSHLALCVKRKSRSAQEAA